MDLPAPPAEYRIPYGDGEFHFGDLRLPAGGGPHPVAIAIHGGFWRAARDLQYLGHICEALRRAGIATWNIEYRRTGHPGGGYPGTLADVAAATAHLPVIAESHRLDLARVVAIGHSAGGHLALWLAASKPGASLRGAVALGGVADLRRAWELRLSNTVVADFMGAAPDEIPGEYQRASPIENLPSKTSTRLIHGIDDDVVPIEIAERYLLRAVAAGDDCRLIALPGAGHFEVVDPRAKEWAIVQHTISELLTRALS